MATIEDSNTVLKLILDFYVIDNYDFVRSKSRTAFLQLIGDKSKGRLWIIKSDKKVIGYIILTFGFSFEHGGRSAFLEELYLIESYRDKGIGIKLLQFLSDEAKKLDVKAIYLEVEKHNHRAHKVYTRDGFESPDRIFMKKKIL